MRLRNYGKGLCSCCGGNTRPLYGNTTPEGGSAYIRGNHPQRRYCAPCWNTLGVAPTADDPFGDHDVSERGWHRLVHGN